MARAVIIMPNITLDRFYEDIQASIDARFHNYKPSFKYTHSSEAEYGQYETMANHAQHAGDGVIVKGSQASLDGGKTWQHIERLIR